MQVAAHGRLGGDPRVIETRSGKSMTVASIAVDLPTRTEGETHTEWLGVVCFGSLADKLAKHAKGESISVSGRAQHNSYTDRDGNTREQMQVIADTIVSARTVRPGGGKKKSSEADKGKAAAGGSEAGGERDFDDDIPF